MPCYQEETDIQSPLKRVLEICPSCVDDTYGVILVNDGSLDLTWTKIKEPIEMTPKIVDIDVSQNFSHQTALTGGLYACRGDKVLVIDAGRKDPPELMPKIRIFLDRTDPIFSISWCGL